MKKTTKFFCAIFCALILSGCLSTRPEPSVSRVVTGITVTYDDGIHQLRRYYHTTQKMRPILNYLRWIDPYGTPTEDPDDTEGSLFRITMNFSNGDTKEYLQKADRYMQVDGKEWKYIDPVNAMTLGKMVGEMESDEQI